ncbi:sigma-70 family RNA polymerase sigma factor [Tropicimonas sp. IMCC34043]|uniref:sigma-70 family RNA polymerase sigma factor n=1 Tax=Tropicimonas sp. IMCC34043 TaxID=2248760 RepID=UPI000E285B20|nr:sigma-70 family RNA polymerase sigma factor [Tropicimonas sp. IMCC34043]
MDNDAESRLCEQTAWLIAVRDNRDRDAFARLFEFYAPRIRTMLARSGRFGTAADDIIQDVMLRVWRKSAQFDPARASASAWIYRIARNRHIDVIRKDARPVPEELYIENTAEPDAAGGLALDQESRRLREAIGRLRPDQRAVIEQAYMGELSHTEISEISGLPLGTIKSRIRLGLDKLRHELKDLRTE